MINWNIIPMVYNDSFTYMEWLGKLTYVSENLEVRLDQAEKDIIDLWTKVNDHETRIGELEDWRRDTVDPFIIETNFRLNTLETWKDETVDPFISTISNWKDTVVDPFIVDIGPRMTAAEHDIDALREDLTAENSARENEDEALNDRINEVSLVANEASSKVNRIEIQLEDVGKIRYFIEGTISQSTSGGTTTATIILPDEDWGIVDVRGHYGTTEFRITGARNSTQVVSGDYTYNYDSTTNSISLTINGSITLDRLDYILYTAALAPDEQEQRDIDFFNAMDSNGDGKVDASDASAVLKYYTWLSTSGTQAEGQAAWAEFCLDNPNLDPNAYPDFNGDGKVDARDASNLLGYYSFASTTDTTGLTGPEVMRMYRTQLEANS